MENVIFKYSEFFEDDGGFNKIRSDFDKLGDDLIKKAKEIKSNIKIFDLDDLETFKKIESETETLVKTFEEYGKAKEDVNKIEKEFIKLQKRQSQTNDDQIDELVRLDKELRKLRGDLKEINTLSQLGIKTDRNLNKERIQTEVNIKKINKEIRKQQDEIVKSNELSKDEQKLIKAKLTLQKTEIKSLNDVRERIAALRVVVQSMDYKEQAEEIKAFNTEINALTDVLSENSDKFIQSKINIGNYEESIKKALQNTSFFQGELAVLNGVVNKLIGWTMKSTAATKANTTAQKQNSKAIIGTTKAIKVLNNVAKATGILILIAAIASLAAIFSQGRSGAIATQRVMQRLAITMKVTLSVLKDVGWGIVTIFKGIGNSISNTIDSISLFGKEIKLMYMETTAFSSKAKDEAAEYRGEVEKLQKQIAERKPNEEYAKGWEQIKTAIAGIPKAYEDAKNAIKTTDKGIINAFIIGDKIKQAQINMASLRKEVRLLEIEAGDSTISLNKQLNANNELSEKKIQLLRDEAKIQKLNLQLANAKARADAEAHGYYLSADDVQFAKQLLEINRQLDPTANPLDDSLLEESVNALIQYEDALTEVAVTEKEIAKQRREIQRDLFEQNLDLLIDLIDTEKNLSEQYVNDTTRSFQNRINEFNRFLVVFRQNSQRIMEEFTKEAKNMGNDLNYEISFKEDGTFDVFMNDTKLAVDNIVELNKQLQDSGMNEIDINRFREFIIETRNGVRDFKDLNKELSLVGIRVQEMNKNLTVSRDEVKYIYEYTGKLAGIESLSQNTKTIKGREKLNKELERLEKEKEEMYRRFEVERQRNRIASIDEELLLVEYESERYYELMQERMDIVKNLQDQEANLLAEKTKEANDKAIAEWKKFAEEVRSILDQIIDKILEVNAKRVEDAQKSLSKQSEMQDEQRRRAEQGLENTLAFEQREMGKREAELIKRQKKQERLEKIKALYSSYNNYSQKGDENPIAKALRDFAILEAVAASFGEGGVVEDRLPSNGIFRGQSHRGNNGGIPILVEGKEGIFSAREMANLGKDNFYRMKELAGMGKIDSNFFSRQRQSFSESMAIVPVQDERFLKEIQDVKKAIENKPVPNFSVHKLVNGTMEIIEETQSKNHKKRNIYIVKKPRL